ncbi:MAG: hypothetical protein ACI4QX_05055, partial [Lachnospiraceae bacterium]
MTSSACNKGEKVEEEKEPDFVYPAEQVLAFCTDAESNLYTYEADGRSIRVYDKAGTMTKEVPVQDSRYTNLCTDGNTLYAFSSVANEETRKNAYSLVGISMLDGSQEQLYENPLTWNVDSMEWINGSLYFLEKEVTDLAESAALDDLEGGYSYGGERLVRLNPATKEETELSVERLKAVLKKDENSLWVYAYDIEAGEYYFTVYDAKNGMFGEKYHVGKSMNGYINAFAYDEVYEKVLYVNVFKEAILAAEPMEANNQTSFYETAARPMSGNELQYRDGYTYFLSEGEVTRIKNSNYIRDNVALKIYSTSYYELPEGTGFNLNLEYVEEDAMAMALMAGDSDYDMLILSSGEPLAEQIRRIGAYEPLNQ